MVSSSSVWVSILNTLTTSVTYVSRIINTILKEQIKLVIIDSISNPLRDVEPIQRTISVYKLLGDLQLLATTFNFAIVITNDYTTRIKDNEAYCTPSFGASFFDRINSRICLSKNNNIHCAELVKSVNKLPTKVHFCML